MGFSRLPLLWRVFAINAGLLLVGTLVLALSAGRIHASIAVVETLDVVVGAGGHAGREPAAAPADARAARPARRADAHRRPAAAGPAPGRARAASRSWSSCSAFNQMLDRLEAERRESSRRALAAQEAERLRIARGLHDEVGQVLTGVLLQLDALAEADPAAVAARVDETKEAVRHALEEVRRIAQELRPELLEHLGLVSALTELSRTFARPERNRRRAALRRRPSAALRRRPSSRSTASPRRA